MASNIVKSNRMKRMESRKSHSWWWDSHISPKNSKWLQENLEEMDLRVKEMLKLIEEDADSFAKKAEMYYQKRPELITLVEDFYRMYRSLAERYDHVTGELRKNIPSDLQSQGSGVSDVGSEPPSTMPSPDRRSSYRKSGNRAAGFDYFLGGNGSDLYNKEGDESSTLDSESETDDSFGNNNSGTHGNDDEHRLRQRVIELEVELCEVKEKLLMREEEFLEGYFRNYGDGNYEVLDKMAKYEEEISNLKIEIQKYKSLGEIDDPVVLDSSVDAYSLHKIQTLEEELRIAQQKLHESEEEVMRKGSDIQNLQEQLKSAKNELEKESGEVSKLHECVASYKTNLAARDVEIRGLKEAISNANKSLSEENEQLQREINRLAQERAYLEDNLKGLDVRFRVLEEELRRANEGRAEMETTFTSRINQLKDEIENKNECMGELKKALDALQAKHNALVIERDELNADASDLSRELSFKDDRIDQMSTHLHQLHMEHVDLIAAAEGARRSAEELKSRIKELEREVEKKERIIVQGAEEKREAIRQLCFSLEHYRNGYHRLREVVTGQKSVVAT